MAEALMVQGKALAALEKYDRAGEVLLKATAVAEEVGQRRVLWQILAALVEVETKLGISAASGTALAERGR